MALEGASLSISCGDFVGIIGPNGGGKTTFIKALLGLVQPCDGRIIRSKGLRIGYMPQHRTLDTSFPVSVMELVCSGLQGGALRRKITSSDKAYCCELLEMTGISDISGRQIGELSGGQLQRAMLCRSIVSRPDLLILDEPTTYVDSRFQDNFYSILEKLNSTMSIIIVSHDLGTICSHVRSIACINRTLHYHPTAEITPAMLTHYECPLKILAHGSVAHTVLTNHRNG